MKQLIVAATASQIEELKVRLADATAGRWTRHVELLQLSDTSKAANTIALRNVSGTHPEAECFADKNVTPVSLESSGIIRMTRAELGKKTVAWLDDHCISWRGNVEECRKHGVYGWLKVDEWLAQFARFDSKLGPRVAKAILAQLRIVGAQQVGAFLTDDLSETAHSTYFLGADPHSGDHGLVPTLSQLVNNQKLSEAFKLPVLAPESRIRMFNDGGWSGGESSNRLNCMYRKCDRKKTHIDPSVSLEMRFAFITDIAEKALEASISQIEDEHKVGKGSISISYPAENRLAVMDDAGETTGLAFRDPVISQYVSPADMAGLCKRIGKKISGKRPLGTHKIASTIGFSHSLPKAMLPVLIMGGGPIRDGKGGEFKWRPLISSQHVLRPQVDDPDYHCKECPLAPKDVAIAAVVDNAESAAV